MLLRALEVHVKRVFAKKKDESKRKLNAARNVCFNALKRQILREQRAV